MTTTISTAVEVEGGEDCNVVDCGCFTSLSGSELQVDGTVPDSWAAREPRGGHASLRPFTAIHMHSERFAGRHLPPSLLP